MTASEPAIKVGDSFWLVLSAQNAENLFLINSFLRYPHEKLEVETSEDLPIWEAGGLFGESPEIDVKFVNNVLGELVIGVSPQDDKSPGVTGSGEFLQIKMKAKLSGAATLTWGTDSGAYVPDEETVLRRVEANFKSRDLIVEGSANGLTITINILPA